MISFEVINVKKYCEVCGNEVNTNIVLKEEEYIVCGEKVVVEAKVMTCCECGEEFYNEELDNETLVNAYNIYRQRHKLLMPDEIRQIREQYGLSQRSFAKLLNWGDKTIHRYENGSLQDKAHNSMLLFLREPMNMADYLAENEVGLDAVQKEKLQHRLAELEGITENRIGKKLLDLILQKDPCLDNGFKSFNYEKFYGTVLFFANKCEDLLKVKLLKLLNYSDMIFYKENGISITGTQYVHLPFGPVPEHYDVLFGLMEAQKIININISFENGYEKHHVLPMSSDYMNILSQEEIDVMTRVFDKFVNFGSVEISNYSHEEVGYKETKRGEIISYNYAKDIELERS